MAPKLAKRLFHPFVLQGLLLSPGLAGAQVQVPTTPAAAVARADQQAQSGDPRGALIELKNAVAEQPDDAELRLRLGRLYLDLGDPTVAEKELQRAVDLGRDDFETHLLLAKARLDQGDTEAVLSDRDLDGAQTPEDRAAVKVLLGRARLAQNQAEGARLEFAAALTEVPRYSPALIGLTRVKLQARDFAGVEQSLRDAAAGLEADEAQILTLRGDLALAQERYQDAVRAYQDALKLRPYQTALLRALAAAQIGTGQFSEADANLKRILKYAPKDLDTLYYQAVLAFQQQDDARANEQIQAVLNSSVAYAPALRLAGLVSYRLKHFQQAREYLSQYHGLVPEDAAAGRLLGITLLQVDDPAKAYEVLKPLAAGQTQDAALLAAVGTAATLSGKAAEGAAYLQRAQALAPDDSDLKARLAASQVAAGNRKQGLAELMRLAQSDPKLTELAFPVTAALLAHGEFTQALAAAAHVRAAHPEQAKAWSLQGIAQVGAGDLDAAQASFRKALTLDPNDPDARTGLADLQYRRGDAAGAIAALQAILTSHPDDQRTLINLAGIEDASGQTDSAVGRLTAALARSPADPALRTALARIQVRQLRPQEALDLLADADQDDPEVLLIRGQAELAAARNESALATFKRLVAAHPDRIEARLLLARAYQAVRDWPAAHQEIAAALAQDPQGPGTRLAAVRCTLTDPRATKEQAAAAVATLTELAKAYPEDPHIMQWRGRLLARMNKPQEALAVLQAAYKTQQTSDSVQSLAATLFDQDQRDQAIGLLRDWLSANPQDNTARLRLAQLEVITGNYRGAAEDLSSALRQHAEGAELQTALAWTLALAGRTDEAAPLAEQAVRRDPKDALAAHALALVYLAQGKSPRAVEVLRPVMSGGAARNPRMQLDYARALAGAGDAAGARAALKRLLETSPDTASERTEAKALLGRLPR